MVGSGAYSVLKVVSLIRVQLLPIGLQWKLRWIAPTVVKQVEAGFKKAVEPGPCASLLSYIAWRTAGIENSLPTRSGDAQGARTEGVSRGAEFFADAF
jgi:hypothetical protein